MPFFDRIFFNSKSASPSDPLHLTVTADDFFYDVRYKVFRLDA